jgi:small multidrug resistance pump
VTLIGYALAFYFLTLTLKTMPVGIVYAVWSGAGVLLIAAIGWIWYRQPIDARA